MDVTSRCPIFWKIIETYNNFIGKTIKVSGQIVKIIDINYDDLEFNAIIVDQNINEKNTVNFEDIQEVLTNYRCNQCKLPEQCSIIQNTSLKTCENCGSYQEEVNMLVEINTEFYKKNKNETKETDGDSK